MGSEDDQPMGAPEKVAGLERELPENSAEYHVFVIDPQLDPRKTLLRLDEVRKVALKLASELTQDYIWQRDGFNLQVKHEKGLSSACP